VDVDIDRSTSSSRGCYGRAVFLKLELWVERGGAVKMVQLAGLEAQRCPSDMNLNLNFILLRAQFSIGIQTPHITHFTLYQHGWGD
jgi:hypothetical protein